MAAVTGSLSADDVCARPDESRQYVLPDAAPADTTPAFVTVSLAVPL